MTVDISITLPLYHLALVLHLTAANAISGRGGGAGGGGGGGGADGVLVV